MGINVNVSTATTPGLLPVEQPDVTGSWDNPMVMVECVWGFSNQLTYGDYNEVTVGGYLDVCFGVLLEVVLGATVEVISPLAVEIIYPMGPLQPLLAALGSGPAMAAATAAGWTGRTKAQGGDKPGLQYDVVFGNYVEMTSELKFTQHRGDHYDAAWMKTVVADTHTVNVPTADHQEWIGIEGESGVKTLVSAAAISLQANAGPFKVMAGSVGIASEESGVTLTAGGTLAVFNNSAGAVNLSGVDSMSLASTGTEVTFAPDLLAITAATVTFSAPEPQSMGSTPIAEDPLSLAAAIIAQASAAVAAATDWAASAAAEQAAMNAWPRIPEDEEAPH
jgi:hypothetical protein